MVQTKVILSRISIPPLAAAKCAGDVQQLPYNVLKIIYGGRKLHLKLQRHFPFVYSGPDFYFTSSLLRGCQFSCSI